MTFRGTRARGCVRRIFCGMYQKNLAISLNLFEVAVSSTDDQVMWVSFVWSSNDRYFGCLTIWGYLHRMKYLERNSPDLAGYFHMDTSYTLTLAHWHFQITLFYNLLLSKNTFTSIETEIYSPPGYNKYEHKK